MAVRILSSAFMLFGAVACAADTFCADVEALTGSGASGATQAFVLPKGLSAAMTVSERAAECRTSLALSGGSHVHCNWSFGYRSDQAKQVFQGLISAVATCLGPEAAMTTESSVNHPDAYDLRMFDRGGQEFAVSLKDKGALQQTLVFVRVQKR
jgi:hypothetical protein